MITCNRRSQPGGTESAEAGRARLGTVESRDSTGGSILFFGIHFSGNFSLDFKSVIVGFNWGKYGEWIVHFLMKKVGRGGQREGVFCSWSCEE